MWNYPQMYYFGSAQIFELYQPKKSKRKIRKDSQKLFSYEFNAPLELRESPSIITEEDPGGSWELDFLGRIMINTGRILIIPEPVDLTNPYTWIDEIIGGVLIIRGKIHVAVL